MIDLHAAFRHHFFVKLPIYALHGIPDVWIVDVEEKRVVRHLDPSPGGDKREEVAQDEASISPTRIASVTVRISDLW
jgi:Uma2 family endonuclease